MWSFLYFYFGVRDTSIVSIVSNANIVTSISSVSSVSIVCSSNLILGSLSKSLRLALIRLPEVNFPKNEPLRMYVGCIQP